MIDTNNEKMNKRYSESEKMKSDMKKIYSDFTKIKKMFTHMMAQKQNSLPGKMELFKAQYPNTVVPTNKKPPPLGGGNSIKIGGM